MQLANARISYSHLFVIVNLVGMRQPERLGDWKVGRNPLWPTPPQKRFRRRMVHGNAEKVIMFGFGLG